LTLATAPVRNKNVLSGISPPTTVDPKVTMTKTIRYIHIPYCRNWSEIERLVSDSWIAIRGSTDTNNLCFCYMKLIVWRGTFPCGT
jgi:hypothetical protein